MARASAVALQKLHTDPKSKNRPAPGQSYTEWVREKLNAKKQMEVTKTKSQRLQEEIERVRMDTLKMFTELAQMPDINGKGDNMQQMTNMTLAIQQMDMAKLQTEQTGDLIDSNQVTQLLIASGYNGKMAEVSTNMLTVDGTTVPEIAYEIARKDVGSVTILLTGEKGDTHRCSGPGEMAKHNLRLGDLHLPRGEYKVKVVPLDKEGKPIYSNDRSKETIKIPTFTLRPILGWEVTNKQLHFTDGASLISADKIKQIASPVAQAQGTQAYADLEKIRAAQRAMADFGV